jgi:hypothetical protein
MKYEMFWPKMSCRWAAEVDQKEDGFEMSLEHVHR